MRRVRGRCIVFGGREENIGQGQAKSPGRARAFRGLHSARAGTLYCAVHELLGAHPCHRLVRLLAAHHRGPPASLDQLTVLPGRAAYLRAAGRSPDARQSALVAGALPAGYRPEVAIRELTRRQGGYSCCNFALGLRV